MKNGYYRWALALLWVDNGKITSSQLRGIESDLEREFGPKITMIYTRWSEKLQRLGQYK